MGIKIPTIIDETTKIHSFFETLKKFCKIEANVNTTKTTIICAASIPKANSINGNNLD
jgi:hypothetical protein